MSTAAELVLFVFSLGTDHAESTATHCSSIVVYVFFAAIA
jgi:hypothetical protein